jgi:hypothetical protein
MSSLTVRISNAKPCAHFPHRIHQELVDEKDAEVCSASLNMWDLGAPDTNSGESRLSRGRQDGSFSVHKGIRAFTRCISAVSGTAGHLPFRDSLLTRLVRPALGGSDRCLLIACVAPTMLTTDDSIYTLETAQQARSVGGWARPLSLFSPLELRL